ncbi:putative lipoyltransferase 2, mitochondrial [Chionoecetes opilio]|uniref:Octanoyl-[acyl-carrier-protein]:protein N-octanoyltransferase LIPT2, mitochondrial n=1 Tax=Chionoecetes opilio TaxID=41210 RepID=A0A8J8WMJ4_CHIOP|nr:putative lipoyltransferase 2, mitochondrial [Chionoecetes opilio]
MGSKVVYVHRLGRMSYLPAWELQQRAAARVAGNVRRGEEAGHRLLLLQHEPVYTTGLREADYSPEVEAGLRQTGADFQRTNRGGLITFHGPGQLTAYPILHLRSFSPGIKWYVCSLERTVIRTLRTLGITAHTSPHTGVWVRDQKICALGLQGRHVTTHGLALNCNTDLRWFDNIVPCGLPDKGVTSITQELGREVTVQDVEPHFLKAFSEIFNCKLVMTQTDYDEQEVPSSDA